MQIHTNNHSKFTEVQFFFHLQFAEEIHNLAVVSIFSSPDQELLEHSFQAIYACHYQEDNALVAIDVKNINSVVSMVPYFKIAQDGEILMLHTEHFLVEKIGMEITALLGQGDEDKEEDGQGNGNNADIDKGC